MQHQIEAAAAEVGKQRREDPDQHDGGRRDQRRHQEGRGRAQGRAGEGRRPSARAIEQDVTPQQDARRRVRPPRAPGWWRRWTTRAWSTPSSASPRSAAPPWRAPKASAARSARCACGRRCSCSVLKNDQIVQCDSCQRILYFVPPPHRPRRHPPAPRHRDHRVLRRRLAGQPRPGRLRRVHRRRPGHGAGGAAAARSASPPTTSPSTTA